jgi:addiction module RelE/StbE family toxin
VWKIQYSKTFEKQYSKLSSELSQRVQSAINELESSDDPMKLGEPKQGSLKNCFAYDIGRKYRIIYNVCKIEIVVLLLKVGKHKDVYGKD